jgi:hypothetical protein
LPQSCSHLNELASSLPAGIALEGENKFFGKKTGREGEQKGELKGGRRRTIAGGTKVRANLAGEMTATRSKSDYAARNIPPRA